MFADINKALDERTIGHNPERLNLMKGGIVYSNRVTTVSPTYAEEARSGGAAGYLRTLIGEPEVSDKFSGILNGIDTDFWCPSSDPFVAAPFNANSPAGARPPTPRCALLCALCCALQLACWCASPNLPLQVAPAPRPPHVHRTCALDNDDAT